MKEVKDRLISAKPDIIECLKKSLLVAKHFHDVEEIAWIENELLGYKDSASCPTYRTINVAFYEEEYGAVPIGYGTIRPFQKDKILATRDMPCLFEMEQVVECAKQRSIKNSLFDNNARRVLPVLFQGAEFQKIITQVTLKLLTYIEGKATTFSQKPSNLTLSRIFDKFHIIAKLLEERRKDNNVLRPTIEIKDEYDVQDLLRSLLAIAFEPVQREEYTPPYAGKQARVDFFLRLEGIAIETKKTRNKNHVSVIRDEIIKDKAYYSKKREISGLFFFIYDPDSFLTDRANFIRDLEEDKPPKMTSMKVIIKPDL